MAESGSGGTQGDVVGGDKITAGDIQSSVVAIGAGAQVIYKNIERALTAVEVEEQTMALFQRLLAEGMSAYVTRLERQAESGEAATVGNPYKALLEYDISDAARFYGRTSAIQLLSERIMRDSLTVLHAESGAGKTSLIKAGLIPELLSEGNLPLYVRPYDIPAHLAIKRALMPNLAEAPNLAVATLRDFLTRVTDLLGGQVVIIVLDQFEEVFSLQHPDARADFVEQLAECLDDNLLPVRWVLSMRNEWFGRLGRFRPQIRDPYSNEVYLQRLNLDEAREIITRPVAQMGVRYEQGLVERILDDLDNEDGLINPPQLQLVCSTLYDLRTGTTIQASTYDRLGGTSGILQTHLERVMKRQFLPEERRMARAVLESLITSEQRRTVRPRTYLQRALQPFDVDADTFDRILTNLQSSRLLRETEISTDQSVEIGYELAHDYLLDKIKLDPAAQARKRAQELLDQEVADYQRFGTHLNPDKLLLIEAHQDTLVIDDNARELLDFSRKKLKQRRTQLYAGAGVIVVMIGIAVIAAIGAAGANRLAQDASRLAASAEQDRQVAEQAANAAATQQADALLVAADADRAAQNAADQLDEAQAGIVAAQQLADDAQTRLDQINAQLSEQFEELGLLRVAEAPIALAAEDGHIWVLSEDENVVERYSGATGSLQASIAVGREPSSLVWDGEFLWVSNFADSTVQKVNPELRSVVQEIPVNDGPVSLRLQGTELWVVSATANTIQQINMISGQITGEYATGAAPQDVLHLDDDLWVANGDDNTVTQIDIASGETVFSITTGDFPNALVWDERSIWVANLGSNDVQQIDPLTRSIARTIAVGRGPRALFWDGVSLWVGLSEDALVSQILPVTGSVLATYPVGERPTAFTHAEGQMWVANYFNDTIQRINQATGAVTFSLPINHTPRQLIYDGNFLWVVSFSDNTVQRIDPLRRTIDSTYSVRSGPTRMEWDGTTVWVTSTFGRTIQRVDPVTDIVYVVREFETSPGDVIWDGLTAWVSFPAENVLRQIDPVTAEILQTVDVGSAPNRLVFDGRTLWVAVQGDDMVREVDPRSGEILRTIEGLNNPVDILREDNYLWIAEGTSRDIVHRVTLTADLPVDSFELDSTPGTLAADRAGVWVTLTTEHAVQYIDNETGTVQAPIPVGQAPSGIVWDGVNLWVASEAEHVLQVIESEVIRMLEELTP